jgi:hypothetical protein
MTRRASWIALTAAAVTLTAASGLAVWIFIDRDTPKLEAYSAAGSFFSLAYGLPLALASAAISGVIAYLAAKIAERQGDVEILKFVDAKTQPSTLVYRRLTATVAQVFAAGNEAREVGLLLLDRIDREGGPGTSALYDLLEQSAEPFQRPEGAEAFIQGIQDPDHKACLRLAYSALTDIHNGIYDLSARFEELKDDMYASIFARSRFDGVPDKMRPLAWLRDRVPPNAPIGDQVFKQDMPSLVRNLAGCAAVTRALELPGAALSVPDGNYTVDYLGYVPQPYTLRPKYLVQAGDLLIGAYRFNIGAAYILSITQYVPNKDTFASIFEHLFMGRSKVAMNFLDLAIVDERDSISPSMLHTLKPCLEDLNRLIMVDIFDGEGFRPVFYNPDLHGPIPRTGFAEFEDGPVGVAV